MDVYRVAVRNEFTGEIRVVEILSICAVDAQIAALKQLFREEGWRKASAMTPECCNEASA